MRIRIIRSAAYEFRPLSPSELEENVEEWQRFASPSTEIEVVRPLKGAETIESIYDNQMAAAFVLEEVRKAERDGVDGVVIPCMADTALMAARELVDIPVVGAGSACFATAVTLGDKFSIIAPLPGGDMVYRSMLRVYGLESHLASVRSIGIPVLEMRRDLKRLKQAILDQGKRAVEDDGADVIVPGCGGMWGLCQELTEELGVPVIDPHVTVLKFAEMLIGQSLSHSKKAYPRPPEKRREI